MKTRNLVFKEFIWTVIYVLFLLGTVKPILMLINQIESHYRTWPIMLAMLLLTVAFGILLGLPSLISRWNSNRSFNWPKLLIQGLPALLLAVPVFLIMGVLGINHLSSTFVPWTRITHWSYNGYVYYLSGVWFGKVLVDCIKSVDRDTRSFAR